MMKRLFAAFLLAIASFAHAQVQYREIPLQSGVITATGAAATVDTLPQSIPYATGGARAVINCSPVTGTSPSATFSLDAVVGGVAHPMGSATALTAAGQRTIEVGNVSQSVRLSYVIAGTTPSFTCTATLVRQ